MNGIGLSTPVFDLNGSRYFRGCELDPAETQKNDQRARSTSRTATLDGGVSIYDTGYAVGNRDLTIRVPDASPDVSAFLSYLVELYCEVCVTTEEGTFKGVPGSGDKAILDVISVSGPGYTVAITGLPVNFQELLISGCVAGISFDGYMGFSGGGYIKVEPGHILQDLEIDDGDYGVSLQSDFRWFGVCGGSAALNESIHSESAVVEVESGTLDLNYRSLEVNSLTVGAAGTLTKLGSGSGYVLILIGGAFQADPDATISPLIYFQVYGDFYGGGHVYSGLDLYTQAGVTRVLEGSNTFSWLGLGIETAGDGQGTIEIEAGSTQTIVDDWPYFGGIWEFNYQSGECLLTSSGPWYLDVAGATGVCESRDCTYANCEIVGSGAEFQAFGYYGNVDGGGNVGIDFAPGVIAPQHVTICTEDVQVSVNPHVVPMNVAITPRAPSIVAGGIPMVDVTIAPLAPSLSLALRTKNVTISAFAPIPPDVIVGSLRFRINVRNPSVTWQIPSLETPGARIIYKCVLTDPDGLADLELPLSSFQARLRDGEPSYLSCVVPNSVVYAEGILARVSGELFIKQGYRMKDGRELLQEIIRVNNETLAIDRGAKNDSATLVGHKTTTSSTPAECFMMGVSYFSLEAGGKRRIRCEIDLFLRPGDICIYGPGGSDWFITGQISYRVSATPPIAIMEVAER